MHSEQKVLQIEIVPPVSYHDFDRVIDENSNNITKLVIVQKDYTAESERNPFFIQYFVSIPDTVAKLTELQSVSISARIETVPICLCTLKKLELLDLTGSYNLLKIPSAVLALPNLKIKTGTVISPASEVLLIGVPKHGISNRLFSVLSNKRIRKFSQLIIRQETDYLLSAELDAVILPDVCDTEALKCLCVEGNVPVLPSWIWKQKGLNLLRLSGSFDNLSESLGEMNELNSLYLDSWRLRSLPECIGNLSNLVSLNLTGCSNLQLLPESLTSLSKLQSLGLAGSSKCYRRLLRIYLSWFHLLCLTVAILNHYPALLVISMN